MVYIREKCLIRTKIFHAKSFIISWLLWKRSDVFERKGEIQLYLSLI